VCSHEQTSQCRRRSGFGALQVFGSRVEVDTLAPSSGSPDWRHERALPLSKASSWHTVPHRLNDTSMPVAIDNNTGGACGTYAGRTIWPSGLESLSNAAPMLKTIDLRALVHDARCVRIVHR
jgi:hypothetical protein